jgi:hypothetical protein
MEGMGTIRIPVVLLVTILTSGCTGIWRGHGQAWMAEYAQHKAAILGARDAASEADALHEMGGWIKSHRYYVYSLSTSSQPHVNGVDIAILKPGEPVHFYLDARSNFENRDSFIFTPKDKKNLMLLAD